MENVQWLQKQLETSLVVPGQVARDQGSWWWWPELVVCANACLWGLAAGVCIVEGPTANTHIVARARASNRVHGQLLVH